MNIVVGADVDVDVEIGIDADVDIDVDGFTIGNGWGECY